MRSLSATLLAAATRWGSRPRLSADVQNHRLRWTRIYNAAPSGAVPTDAIYGFTRIRRVCNSGAGNILWQEIPDPTVASQWASWTTVKTDAVTGSSVAISGHTTTSQRIRIVYVRQDGANVKASWTESTDGGSSWTATQDIVAGLAAPIYVACSQVAIGVMNADQVRFYSLAYGGAPGSLTSPVPSGITSPHGLALTYILADNNYPALFTYNGYLVYREYDATSNTWGTAHTLLSQQTPATWMQPRRPAIAYLNVDGIALVGSYLDENTGFPSTWSQPVIITSRDRVHWGDACALNLQTSSTHEKAALAYDDTNQLIYACQYSQACRSEVYSDKTAFHFTTDKINRWEYRKTRHLPAYARLTLIDTAEAWRGFGASGAAQSVQPLAELRVSRGYRTSAGEETETTPRLYILSAEYTAHQGRGQLIITATDAFGLLDLFRPQRPAIYSAQTLAYIAAAIAARAGIQIETDSAAAWSTSIAEFTWLPTTSALYALTQVLNLGGGIARVESSGKIKLYDFAAYAPASKPTIGASSEIRSARWGSATPEGNAHFTAGAEHSYRAQDLADTMSLGLTLERATHDTRLPSAASCQQAANAALRTLSGYAARGWAVIPLRPDLETWDMVRIQTDTAILPLNTERVLTTLTEWYNREDLTCQSALELTGD